MDSQTTKPSQQPATYLSPDQQDLLLAALNSQASTSQPAADGRVPIKSETLSSSVPNTMSGVNQTLFMSPQDASLDNLGLDYTPDLDYIDGADNFDFEDAELGGEMIGALPGSGADTSTGDGHEKRKSPDEDAGAPEGDAKRQDTQEGEKGAKKPGRKPLTSEPTTKRKAQNRAAQRAFRERKEKHLKDLETKVADLTKTQEADKHENGLLKAQVERLQIELREYRKRLSLNSSASRGSPPLNATAGQHRSNSGGGFQFDFPKFGGLPGSQLFGRQNTVNKRDNNTPPAITQSPTDISGLGHASRQNSQGRSISPQSVQGNGSSTGSPAHFANVSQAFAPYSTNNNMHGFANTLPQMNNNPFGDLFSPNLLKSANVNQYFGEAQTQAPTIPSYTADNGGDSTAGLNRVFQFNGGSISDTSSPSASSGSQWNVNGNSSCGTSPEPSHDSPALKDNKEKQADSFNSQSQITSSDVKSQPTMNTMFGFGNNDFNAASMNSFDPVLFGDYRDSNNAIVGGEFSGGFFDDAVNSAPFDYGSPSNLFGILQSPQQTQQTLSPNNNAANAPTPSRNLMAEIEKTRDGGDDDYGLPTSASKDTGTKFVSCNSIWNQLQSNPDFQEGKFDLDSLCAELSAKAKCSESGMFVDQDHVQAALARISKKNETGKALDIPPLMFEQESWDNVLKKLKNGGQMQ